MSLCQIAEHTILAQDLSSQSVVVDLGANLGRFSHGIVERFGCRSLAVEANPSLCARIASDPRISVLNLAVAATSGTIPLHLSGNCERSSILSQPLPDVTSTIEVRAVTLGDLLATAGLTRVDLVKFDIEGAEIEVLDSCSDAFLMAVPQLTIEFHDFLGLTPRSTVERVLRRLEKLDFLVIGMWRQAYGDTLCVNRRHTSASLVELLEAQYITRNWWGLKRVAARSMTHVMGL